MNNFCKPCLLLLLTIFFLPSCNHKSSPHLPKSPKVKNVILLIGDGMGLTQVSTAYYYSDTPSNFSQFKCIGLHQNNPVGNKITDSAAGATAFSIGLKSYNGAIGIDGDSMPHQTILELAAAQGKSTGLVATSSITHATPASFFAHVKSRNFHEEIAAEFVNAPVDFAIGGGIQYFNRRKDGRDCLTELRNKGVLVDTLQFQNTPYSIKNRYAYFLAPTGLPKMTENRGDFLPNATNAALDYLSQNDKGFFLMVEGSQIDWGGHDNIAEYVIEEVKDFDKTIGVALDFAKKEGNTLVIVTADHETGGLALSAFEAFGKSDYNQINPTFSTGGHTAALIPVFAYGPGASQFMGIYQNNEIFEKMKNGFLE